MQTKDLAYKLIRSITSSKEDLRLVSKEPLARKRAGDVYEYYVVIKDQNGNNWRVTVIKSEEIPFGD